MSWIVDITIYQTADGREQPGLHKIHRYFCSIVAAASSLSVGTWLKTEVVCRRRPRREACQGRIWIFRMDNLNEIEWQCETCHDNGFIRNWKGSVWDRRQGVN